GLRPPAPGCAARGRRQQRVGDRMPFLIALALGLALTPLAGRIGRAAGLVDRPGDPLKIHREPVPVLGGVAVVAAVFAALAILDHLPAAVVVVATVLMLAG